MSDEKKSKALNFRVASSFRDKVEKLSRDSSHEVSDICRFGLLACWPEIEALVLANPGPLLTDPEQIRELREIIDLARTAKSRGVDLRCALTDALEAKLTAEVAATPAA